MSFLTSRNNWPKKKNISIFWRLKYYVSCTSNHPPPLSLAHCKKCLNFESHYRSRDEENLRDIMQRFPSACANSAIVNPFGKWIEPNFSLEFKKKKIIIETRYNTFTLKVGRQFQNVWKKDFTSFLMKFQETWSYQFPRYMITNKWWS